MRERWRADLAYWGDSLGSGVGQIRAQFVGGRYPARRFVLFAIGIVVLHLPFLLTGIDGIWLNLTVGLPMLWVDWRHAGFFAELHMIFMSLADVPPSEQVRLRTALPLRYLTAIEIVATDRGIRWGTRALSDAGSTLGLTGRTAIEFSEIQRLERTRDELRIWTRTDTYSIRLFVWNEGRGKSTDEWFAYLKEKCPDAEFSVQEPEAVRNSRLLKPTIVTIIALTAGVPYGVFVVIAFRDAGWL